MLSGLIYTGRLTSMFVLGQLILAICTSTWVALTTTPLVLVIKHCCWKSKTNLKATKLQDDYTVGTIHDYVSFREPEQALKQAETFVNKALLNCTNKDLFGSCCLCHHGSKISNSSFFFFFSIRLFKLVRNWSYIGLQTQSQISELSKGFFMFFKCISKRISSVTFFIDLLTLLGHLGLVEIQFRIGETTTRLNWISSPSSQPPFSTSPSQSRPAGFQSIRSRFTLAHFQQSSLW